LNKDLEAMSRYAVKVLGRKNVSITTNLALFPTDLVGGVMQLMRLGMPRTNVSLDREHLRYGKEMEERVRAFFAAAKKIGIRVHIQNVAQTKYQEKHRWPRNIARLIPKALKEEVKNSRDFGRREFYSDKKSIKTIKDYSAQLKSGEHVGMLPFGVVMALGVFPLYGGRIPVEVHFSCDGKAYLFSGIDALHVPQLSLGSWRRETLQEIIRTNLPYKVNFIKSWLGMTRIGPAQRHSKFAWPDKENPKKSKLFGKYVERKVKEQKARRRNPFKR